MVSMCTQECPRKERVLRATEFEAVMHQNGFVSVHTSHLEMKKSFGPCWIYSTLMKIFIPPERKTHLTPTDEGLDKFWIE